MLMTRSGKNKSSMLGPLMIRRFLDTGNLLDNAPKEFKFIAFTAKHNLHDKRCQNPLLHRANVSKNN